MDRDLKKELRTAVLLFLPIALIPGVVAYIDELEALTKVEHPEAPPSREISQTIYTPAIHFVDTEACKVMFPPESVGGLCEYGDGVLLPDGCASGYHMERQRTDFGIPSFLQRREPSSGYRKVCHKDAARGEIGWGLACERTERKDFQ